MSPESEFEFDSQHAADNLLTLAARNAVLEHMVRHLAVLFFAGTGGEAAFNAMREDITGRLQFAQAPPATDADIALEMQRRALEYARAFFAQLADDRANLARAFGPHGAT